MWTRLAGLVTVDREACDDTANEVHDAAAVDNVNEIDEDDWIVVDIKDSTNLEPRRTDSPKKHDGHMSVASIEEQEAENDERLLDLDAHDEHSTAGLQRNQRVSIDRVPGTLTLGHFIRHDSHLPNQRVQHQESTNQLNRNNLSREPKKHRPRKNKMKQLSGMNNDRKCQ